jgi:hypothetical protein
MNQNPNERFAAWYNKIDPQPSPDLIEKRLLAVDKIIEIKDRNFWIDLVRGYFSLTHLQTGTNNELVTKFMDADPTFPLTKNEKLIETLTAITLVSKLLVKDQKLNDFIALLVVNNVLLRKKPIDQHIPVVTAASNYLTQLASSQPKLGFSAMDKQIQALDTKFSSMDSDSSELELDNKNCIQIISLLKNLRNNQKALAVELNVLWWLFGQFSMSLSKSFKALGITNMVLVGPFEMSDEILDIQNLKAVKPILQKALALTDKEHFSDPITVVDLLTKADPAVLNMYLDLGDDDLLELTPVLHAIRLSKGAQPGELLKRLKSADKHLDYTKAIRPEELSSQLLNELICAFNFYQ